MRNGFIVLGAPRVGSADGTSEPIKFISNRERPLVAKLGNGFAELIHSRRPKSSLEKTGLLILIDARNFPENVVALSLY